MIMLYLIFITRNSVICSLWFMLYANVYSTLSENTDSFFLSSEKHAEQVVKVLNLSIMGAHTHFRLFAAPTTFTNNRWLNEYQYSWVLIRKSMRKYKSNRGRKRILRSEEACPCTPSSLWPQYSVKLDQCATKTQTFSCSQSPLCSCL